MAKKGYAKRYAQAAFEIALEKKEPDKWQSDLEKIASLAEDETVAAWLENPKVNFDVKAKLLGEQLGEVGPLALNLTYILIIRGRLSMARDIADEFKRLLNSYHGIEEAEVITAVPLDDKDEQHLAEQLAGIVGKQVLIKPRVDPGIVGGVVARIGDQLLDASTASRLQALKRELAK